MTTSSANLPLPDHTADQRSRFSAARKVLDEAVSARAFPGAAFSVTHAGNLVALDAAGGFTYQDKSPAVTADTVFDIASVTKVVATTSMAMLLYQRKKLELERRLASLLPGFASSADPGKENVTLAMLLAHSSGLPAYERLYETATTPGELRAAAQAITLVADPGTRAEYSDIGFMLLGDALSLLAGETIDAFCSRELFIPLGMARTTYRPPESWKSLIPPTVDDRAFRHRIIQGEVHDENASVMGGVSGHAGLFSNAGDLARFAQALITGGPPVFQAAALRAFLQRQPPAGSSRALGWDTPSPPSQSGRYFSPGSFGHLGYTGTSLWIDPERRISIVLLTNRTWPDRSSHLIKQVRPAFHDAVMQVLE